MTRSTESNVLDRIVELLAEQGFDGMAQVLQLILNQAMLVERSQVLGAEPYQRTSERTAHANGFKPKTVLSRLGKLELQIPQTRGGGFGTSTGNGAPRAPRENTAPEAGTPAAGDLRNVRRELTTSLPKWPAGPCVPAPHRRITNQRRHRSCPPPLTGRLRPIGPAHWVSDCNGPPQPPSSQLKEPADPSSDAEKFYQIHGRNLRAFAPPSHGRQPVAIGPCGPADGRADDWAAVSDG